jgi:hypothetical protein
MYWFWLNIPLATVFFLAMTLIPLWLVIKHPDSHPDALAQDQRPAERGLPASPLGAWDYGTSRPREYVRVGS